MSLHHSPKIVTNGLVLCLDAGNRKSYSGSGTIWKDLAGNNNGTLTNGPTFSSVNGGSIVFDGVDDYISCGNLSSMGITNDFTIEIWLQVLNLNTGNGYITVFDTTNRSLSLWIGSQYYGVGGSSTSYGNNFNWQNNKWISIFMKRSGSNVSIIKNNFEARESLSSSSTNFNNNLEFGSNPSGGGTVFKGNISNIKLYNIALTDAQILQNYNATKGRFNI